MGISASSLLDETKSNYIKGQAEAELKEFSPYYRKQFSVAHFSQVEDELEQHKEKITQLLKQREAPEVGEVLYEEGVLYFDDTRKWRERYVVVRANYCLECHDSLESFVKGVPPRHKLLPTGGAVLTTEEKYMAAVDKCFPDDTNNVKEEFAPPLAGMPGQFPVYLRLPYRRDSYFCFRQEAKQAGFLSILSDCIRHQNQDFLKKKTCEVQAFLKAIRLYREEKGRYEAWDMLIGSDVRVMANLVMEQLLPCLEKDMLPRLKAKKTERKRVWFATVEAAYILVQEHLFEGLSALKAECRTLTRQQEVLIHSDMDQIVNSRRLVEDKLRAGVSQPAEKFCSESVQPYLASILEELMEPISSGFQEGRQLSDSMMDQLCQNFQEGRGNDELKKDLACMARPNLLSCYQKIGSLQERLHHLQERFGFSNITSLIHSAQIDLQQLIENAAYTFELLLYKAIQDNPDNAGSAIEKAKPRVLKQYDYDSSTVRKRIFQEALVAITLPHIKKNLSSTCKAALQGLDQFIYADHSNYVHIENVYECILVQTLDQEVTKVVKEAASLKKHNLFTDSRDLLSQSSRSSISSPPGSTPGSPDRVLASPTKPPSPLVVNGLGRAPQQEMSSATVEKHREEEEGKAETDATVFATPVEAEVGEVVTVTQQTEAPAPTDTGVVHTVAAKAIADVATTETEETKTETVKEEKAIAVGSVEKVQTDVEPETQTSDRASSDTPTAVERVEVKAQSESPAPEPDSTLSSAPEPDSTLSLAPEPDSTLSLALEPDSTLSPALEPDSTLSPAPEPDSTLSSAPEPDSTLSLAPEPDSTLSLAPEPDSTLSLAPEPDSTPSPAPEPDSTLSLAPEPDSTLSPAPEPDSTLSPAPEPDSTLSPAPEPDSTLSLAPEPDSTLSLAPEPDSTLSSAPEPGSTLSPAPEPDSTLSPAPEPDSTLSSAPEPDSTLSPAPEPDSTLSSAPEPAAEQVSVDTLAEGIASLTVATAEGDAENVTRPCESSENELEAPSSGGAPVPAPRDSSLDLKEDAEEVMVSDSSLNMSAGRDSAPSDPESTEVKVLQSSEDEVSTTSDLVDEEANVSESPVSSDDASADAPDRTRETSRNNPAPAEPTGAISSDVSRDVGADASVNSEPSAVADTATSASAEPAKDDSQAPDCIKDIRDLVTEVIEVEELVQRYPDGLPEDE
ncbi:protein Niban 1a [Diretmus argenteus]